MIDLERVYEIIAPTCIQGKLTNLAPGMSFWHDGTALESGTAVTAATIESSAAAGDITLTVNGAVDTRIGTAGVINVSDGALNTCVEVYDLINAVSGWHCRLEGLLGSDVSDHALFTLAATNCFKVIATVGQDTVAIDEHRLVISNRQRCVTGTRLGEHKTQAIENEHGAINKLYYLWIAVDSSAGTGRIKIYSTGLARAGIRSGTFEEIQIFDIAAAAAGAQTELKFFEAPLTAKPGHRIVVHYLDTDGNITTVDECFMLGKSVIVT